MIGNFGGVIGYVLPRTSYCHQESFTRSFNVGYILLIIDFCISGTMNKFVPL